jgi:hypothetical protein
MFTGKGDLVLFMNDKHTKNLDLFFKYFTHLGDGLVFAFICLGFVFRSYRSALTFAATGGQKRG